MKEVMKCLPTKHQAGVTIATVYDLTRIFPDEVTWKNMIGSQKGGGGWGRSNGIMKMIYWLYWWVMQKMTWWLNNWTIRNG